MTALGVARIGRAQLIFCLTATFFTACSDSAPSPSAPMQRQIPTISTRDAVAASDTSVTVFTIDPTVDGWYAISGGHYLYVDHGGLCDLASPYGPDYWDTPCTPSTTPVVVTAKSSVDALGHPRVDFRPALRFAVQKGRVKTAALLFMYDTVAAKTPHSTILYCNDDNTCVDEGVHDRLMRTDADKNRGYLYRQIKHFSGYEVATGFHDSF